MAHKYKVNPVFPEENEVRKERKIIGDRGDHF